MDNPCRIEGIGAIEVLVRLRRVVQPRVDHGNATVDDVAARRTDTLAEQLSEVQASGDLSEYLALVEGFSEQLEIPIAHPSWEGYL